MDDDEKEWLRFARDSNGRMTVGVTLQRGNLTARWTEKVYTSEIKRGLALARKRAGQALSDLQDAIDNPEEIM